MIRSKKRTGSVFRSAELFTSIVGEQDSADLDTERQDTRQVSPNKRFARLASSELTGVLRRARRPRPRITNRCKWSLTPPLTGCVGRSARIARVATADRAADATDSGARPPD